MICRSENNCYFFSRKVHSFKYFNFPQVYFKNSVLFLFSVNLKGNYVFFITEQNDYKSGK